MVKTFNGLDNEFAISTGSNVNSSPGRSKFDYPPTSSIDLVVTSQEGDTDPNLFEVGETYTVSWSGASSGVILDAAVVRSDDAPGGGGGVIVFEGLDQNGDLVQVVWTPSFDLESWYFDNFVGEQPPEFYTTDQNEAYTHAYVCFAMGVTIGTPSGLKPIEMLSAGDYVSTRDHGRRKILWAGRKTVVGAGRNAPVCFDRGAIGNRRPMRLSQQHRVMVASPMTELFFGHHEVLVPAKALVNGHDIRLEPCQEITYLHLLLEQHEILNAGGGAPCESLLLGDMADTLMSEDLPEIRGLGSVGIRAARPILTYREARCIVGARVPPEAAKAV
ncbi:Hint domain-containing protein [uncultured Roseovarius sp.]|uniref:Hint domain-containing protein n=1 Tax=Roseovarius sp. TaxID=1486281 RepID=UPI0025F0023A|nr:Hint domain-containing protein [uncultured Roseovarius sp.]